MKQLIRSEKLLVRRSKRLGITIYQVDSFTKKPYHGNPAGVCILEIPCNDEWMQKIANEMNLAETAFAIKEGDGYRLRWFTPEVEVDLCGHATLATAHILWDHSYIARDKEIQFYTRSGLLTTRGKGNWIEMDFPIYRERKVPAPDHLLDGLGVQSNYIGKNKMDYLVHIESESILRNIKPDYSILSKVDMRGVIVTSPCDSGEYDFICRFFAPRVGINEDPVTGSAYTCLGPYWKQRLGKNHLKAYQASKRGGEVQVHLLGQRAFISGQAITVMKTEILY